MSVSETDPDLCVSKRTSHSTAQSLTLFAVRSLCVNPWPRRRVTTERLTPRERCETVDGLVYTGETWEKWNPMCPSTAWKFARTSTGRTSPASDEGERFPRESRERASNVANVYSSTSVSLEGRRNWKAVGILGHMTFE